MTVVLGKVQEGPWRLLIPLPLPWNNISHFHFISNSFLFSSLTPSPFPKHSLYLHLLYAGFSELTAVVSGSSLTHPSLIVREIPGGEDVQVFLVCQQVNVSKIAGMEAPLVLLAAYYSYDMQYPKGLNPIFTLLQVKPCG